MSPEEIAAALLRQPFVPLRITQSEEPKTCQEPFLDTLGMTLRPNARPRKQHNGFRHVCSPEKGVIRFKHLPRFTPKPLDDVVDSLLSAMAP